jgi:hypothetical protein
VAWVLLSRGQREGGERSSLFFTPFPLLFVGGIHIGQRGPWNSIPSEIGVQSLREHPSFMGSPLFLGFSRITGP